MPATLLQRQTLSYIRVSYRSGEQIETKIDSWQVLNWNLEVWLNRLTDLGHFAKTEWKCTVRTEPLPSLGLLWTLPSFSCTFATGYHRTKRLKKGLRFLTVMLYHIPTCLRLGKWVVDCWGLAVVWSLELAFQNLGPDHQGFFRLLSLRWFLSLLGFVMAI